MASEFHALLSAVQKYYPESKGLCSEQWSAGQQSYRSLLRQSIAQTLNLNESQSKIVNNLEQPPQLKEWSVSISHCPIWGGWLAVPRPAQIGFDIELLKRLRPEVIERISTQEELKNAPDRRLIWGAKEAFYKALEKKQPPTILDLKIENWNKQAPNQYSFRGHSTQSGEGMIICSADLLFAFCLISST